LPAAISADITSSPAGGFSIDWNCPWQFQAWFLPAALADGGCGALAAISAHVGLDGRLAAAHAHQCQSLVRVLVHQASV